MMITRKRDVCKLKVSSGKRETTSELSLLLPFFFRFIFRFIFRIFPQTPLSGHNVKHQRVLVWNTAIKLSEL